MEMNLKKIVTDYNKNRGLLADKDSSVFAEQSQGNPTTKIVEILNSHHDTLASLNNKSRQLQKEMISISRDLKIAPSPY
jgi:hypothetical protein